LAKAGASLLDRAIGVWSPRRAFQRVQYRRALEILDRHKGRGRRDRKFEFESYRHGVRTRLNRAREGFSGGADAHLTATEREGMLESSRDLERNNSIAKGMLDRVVENVVGTGITPQAQSGDEEWNDEAEDRFGGWAERGCDVQDRLSFWQMQRLALRSLERDGDVGFVLNGGQLQAVEADRIVTPNDKEKVTQGIELNAVGKPVAYWVADYAARQNYINSAEATRVEARNFIHLFDPERFSQTRGCPALGTCLNSFDQLDQYIEATLVDAMVSACVGGIITGNEQVDPLAASAGNEEDETGEDQRVIDLEPGVILNLSGSVKGDFKSLTPSKPAPQFPDFVSAILRFLGL